jgi:hypothetical protein
MNMAGRQSAAEPPRAILGLRSVGTAAFGERQGKPQDAGPRRPAARRRRRPRCRRPAPRALRRTRPVHANDEPESPAPPRFDARERVLDDHCARGRDAQAPRSLEEDRRFGLVRQAEAAASVPSNLTSKSSRTSAGASTSVAFSLAEMTAVCRPRSRTEVITSTVVAKGRTPSWAIRSRKEAFLRLPSPQTVSADGGSDGMPSGRVIAREARKRRTPSWRGTPSMWRRYSALAPNGRNAVPVSGRHGPKAIAFRFLAAALAGRPWGWAAAGLEHGQIGHRSGQHRPWPAPRASDPSNSARAAPVDHNG